MSSAPDDLTVPKWASVLDLVTIALLVGAIVTYVTGGYRLEVSGVSLSIRSPDRWIVLAIALAALRHSMLLYPTLFRRVTRLRDRAPAWLGGGPSRTADEVQVNGPAIPAASGRFVELTAVAAFYGVVVVAATHPQVMRLDAVPDLGDPLFSTWRLAWVAHQLPRDPLHLFDANIFHPEPLTLTYSDAMLVPALMAAPPLWLGAHPLHVYNVLLLAALTLSGVAMFLLVRALTGRRDAALVAGTVFALYPYRFEHYSHLELQVTFWMPWLLLALHRTFARGAWRDGVLVGVLFAMQALSSLYYGTFLTVYLLPLTFAIALRSRVRHRAMLSLSVGALTAAALLAPVAAAYIANRSTVGEREVAAVDLYSATPADYLKPHARSRYAGAWDAGAHRPERELFPTIAPVALGLAGMWPPLSAVRVGYVAALALSFELSRGTHSPVFAFLRSHVPPFRGLRAPARFSMMVGLTLAVLAGYGVSRLTRERRTLARWLVTAAAVGVIAWETSPRLELERAWLRPPGIYAALQGLDGVVLADFPLPDPSHPDDARSTYFSTFHWHRIVSGISGHYPTSYIQLLAWMHDFPSDVSLEYLRQRGVTHVAIHGAFYEPRVFRAIARALDRRPDVQLLAAVPFEGSESRLYQLQSHR